jgi:hypothetical protein
VKQAKLLLTCILLMGCTMEGMEPGDPISVGNGIRVAGESGFAQIHIASSHYWTRNGTGLDELGFYTGIKDGEPLFPMPGKTRKDLPAFRARMTPNDVEDLTAAALAAKGLKNVRAAALRPCPFGAATGFCFDLTLANEEGLEMRGKAIARIKANVLDLLVFTAPADFYFDQVGPAIDRIFLSIQAQ